MPDRGPVGTVVEPYTCFVVTPGGYLLLMDETKVNDHCALMLTSGWRTSKRPRGWICGLVRPYWLYNTYGDFFRRSIDLGAFLSLARYLVNDSGICDVYWPPHAGHTAVWTLSFR